MTQPVYASVELMLVARIHELTAICISFPDIHLIDIPEYPNGIYRLLTPDYLRWIRARIELAKRPESGVSPESLQLRQEFFVRCCEASGLSPSEKALPSSYSRPTEASSFTFRGSLDIWEATKPENPDSFPDNVSGSDSGPQWELPDFTPKTPSVYLLCRRINQPPSYYRMDAIPDLTAATVTAISDLLADDEPLF
jgi:hypothetical protein